MKFLSLFIFFNLFVFGTSPVMAALEEGEALRTLPVQADGRIKPFDTFSREMLEIVYGKGSFEGRKAHEIILTWMLSPTAWENKELFEVRNHEVLKALGLDSNRKRFKKSNRSSKEDDSFFSSRKKSFSVSTYWNWKNLCICFAPFFFA